MSGFGSVFDIDKINRFTSSFHIFVNLLFLPIYHISLYRMSSSCRRNHGVNVESDQGMISLLASIPLCPALFAACLLSSSSRAPSASSSRACSPELGITSPPTFLPPCPYNHSSYCHCSYAGRAKLLCDTRISSLMSSTSASLDT